MTLITEFRPVSHEFFPGNFSGAAYIGTSSADALWFYRYDSTFIEVRDVFSCQDKVFAALSTAEIKQRFRDIFKGGEIRFVIIQSAYVGDFHVLIFVVREVQEDRDHVFIWNLLTLHLQLLVSASKLLTAATVTAQQAITVSHRLVKSWGKAPGRRTPTSPTSPTSPRPLISNGSWSPRSSSFFQHEDDENDDEEEEAPQSQVRVSGNGRQLLILGHRKNWMSIYKFTVSRTGYVTCTKDPEHEISINKDNGSITSLAAISDKGAGTGPVILAGSSNAEVYVIQYYSSNGNKQPKVLMGVEDLKSKTLPITSITVKPTTDEALNLLVIGQGHTSNTRQYKDPPMLSVYYLRHQRSDYKLLGEIQPPMEDEALARGEILAATISDDSNGVRIHCAFSIQADQGLPRSKLMTVQINDMDVDVVSVVDLTATEGGSLCDITPQTNSYELSLLYLGKIVNYVHAADVEWERKESDWSERHEATHKDPIPTYGSYFHTQFNYSDAELAEVEQRRRQLGGKLFYDRLLEFVEIDVGVLYPPRDHAQQRNLWTNIYVHGNLNVDNRNCLAYYLLKNKHDEASEVFLNEFMIPPRFVDLMNGFWALDHFDFKGAVLYLSRPGLTVDWIEDVIEAIYEHGSPQLARQFILAANLNLTSDRFLDLKMKVLLATDFTEAFSFQRSSTTPTRTTQKDTKMGGDDDDMTVDSVTRKERLFNSLLDYCFLNKPNRKAIKALALLTFNEPEEQMFVRYCNEQKGVTREVGQEFLIMYYVNHSRYLEAIRMHRKLLPTEERMDTAPVQHTHRFEESTNPRKDMTRSQKRQVLIDNLLMVLPTTQREILDLEDGRSNSDLTESTVGSMSSTTTAKGLLVSLMKEVGEPLTSLKGLDLNWVAKALTRHVLEDEFDQDTLPKDDSAGANETNFVPPQFSQRGDGSSMGEDSAVVAVEELDQFPGTSLSSNNGSGHSGTKRTEAKQPQSQSQSQSQPSKDNASAVEIIDSDDDL
ncbi:nuclear pore complex assembly-domain-containing protein [Mortierella sp. GBAus27b]|nr:nuclear pore complex assembly-domain-containing protein [Mortierella sp. GBAus27b]